MQLEGMVKELVPGSISRFIVSDDSGQQTRVEISQPLPPGLKNGDHVLVTGQMPSDPPFLATSVAIVKAKAKKPLWPWLAAAGALILAIGVFLFLHAQNHTLTVLAVQGAPAVPQAKLAIHLLDQEGIVKMMGQTGANGEAHFKNVANGSYILEYPNPTAASVQPIEWSGSKSPQSITVTSPYTWTLRIGNCNQPVGHAAVQVSGDGQTRESTSDSNGWVNFYNLPLGTYTARSASIVGAPTTSITIDGTTVNQPSQLGTRTQPCPGFLPPIIMRPSPVLLQELRQRQLMKAK